MRIRSFSVFFVVLAIYFIIAVAAEVFVDDHIKPRSLFTYILASTVVTGIAALAVNINIPS